MIHEKAEVKNLVTPSLKSVGKSPEKKKIVLEISKQALIAWDPRSLKGPSRQI